MKTAATSESVLISPQVTRARRFYFGQSSRADREGLGVAGGGWELVAKDYVIDRDTFPWLSIEFVAGGRGRLRILGREHDLQRGSIFAYGAGVRHRIETDPDKELSKYFLNFSGREAVDLMASMALEAGECRTMGNADELEEGLEALIDEGAAGRPQSPAIVALQLRILFLKIAGASRHEEPAEVLSRQTLRRCLHHLDQHFLSLRTVEEVAADCHVSIGHLTRLFTRFGYGSPYRYLTRKKMLHAAALLDSGTLLVREVAERLALDPFQFSRVFKRVHGISPSAFVKRHGTPPRPAA